MREHGHGLSIGERVAWYRVRRGLSQEVLAGLVGRTADWLSKVENGRANLERLSMIKALSVALDVTVIDLLGEPNLAHWTQDTRQQSLHRLRDSLLGYPCLTGSLSTPRPARPAVLQAGLAAIWSAYQAGRFGHAATQIPPVLDGAHWLRQEGADDRARVEGQRLLASGLHAAASILAKVGETQLAWIAADRGLTAAEQTEDPIVVASLMRSVAHSMLSDGYATAAADLVTRSADRLAPVAQNTPTWRSLIGSLHLVGAMAAARANAAPEARAHLVLAKNASQELGYDGNHAWTAFGPSNVAIHDVSIAVELGDIQLALHLADGVDPRPLPVERRVRHTLEIARLQQYVGQHHRSIDAVRQALVEAPEQVRSHFITRELVLAWMKDPRVRNQQRVGALARTLGLLTAV